MQIKRILVVVDPNRDEQPALQRAIWFAEKTSATLELFLVAYNSSFEGFSFFGGGKDIDSTLSQQKEWLEKLAQPIKEKGITTITTTQWDKLAYKAILNHAEETKPDIIFKSAYSENMLKRLFITNSCWQLIRHSTRPLWLVQHDVSQGKCLCAALDPMHSADKPAQLDNQLIAITQSLSTALGMPANYIHSFAPMSRPQLFGAEQSDAYTKYLTNFTKDHTEAFHALLSHYPDIPKNQQFLIKGFAEEVIPHFAQEHQVELMIMGAIARGSIDNLLIGHTAERVLEAIECDLLIIHPNLSNTTTEVN